MFLTLPRRPMPIGQPPAPPLARPVMTLAQDAAACNRRMSGRRASGGADVVRNSDQASRARVLAALEDGDTVAHLMARTGMTKYVIRNALARLVADGSVARVRVHSRGDYAYRRVVA